MPIADIQHIEYQELNKVLVKRYDSCADARKEAKHGGQVFTIQGEKGCFLIRGKEINGTAQVSWGVRE